MIEKDYYSILGVVNKLRMGNMDDLNIQGKKKGGEAYCSRYAIFLWMLRAFKMHMRPGTIDQIEETSWSLAEFG